MEFVTYEQDGYVGIITINRPKALNALNSAVLEELDATFKAVDLDTTRCLILTGAENLSSLLSTTHSSTVLRHMQVWLRALTE